MLCVTVHEEVSVIVEESVEMSNIDLHPKARVSFYDRYKQALQDKKLVAYRPVIAPLLKDRLELNIDIIDRLNLFILLQTLANDGSLKSVSVESHLFSDNPQLTDNILKLHYHCNERLPVYTDPEIMVSMCNALHRHLIKNDQLSVFRLVGIPMTEKHLSIITSAFSSAKKIRILSLERMPLHLKQIQLVSTSLEQLTSLIILNLSGCNLNHYLTKQLSTFLKRNSTLQRLILNSNPIGDSGVLELSKVFKNKPEFRALDLQNCGLTSAGCGYLLELVHTNFSIEVCDIRRNTEVPQSLAITLNERILKNNLDKPKLTSYRPLHLSTTPSIVLNHSPKPQAVPKPSCLSPSERAFTVEASSKKRVQINLSGMQPPDLEMKQKNVDKSVVVSQDFVIRLESALAKFQVLMDYYDVHRKQKHDFGNDNTALGENLEQERHQQKTATNKVNSVSSELPQTSRYSGPRLDSSFVKSSRLVVVSPLNQGSVLSTNTIPQLTRTNLEDSARHSTVLRSQLTHEDLKGSNSHEGNNLETEVLNLHMSTSASSSSSITEQAHMTLERSSLSRNSKLTKNAQSQSSTAADLTLTSGNTNDGLHLASIESSSSSSVNGEIFEDPQILESTRASDVMSGDSSTHLSQKNSSKTGTSFESLEFRTGKGKEYITVNLGDPVDNSGSSNTEVEEEYFDNESANVKVDDGKILGTCISNATCDSNEQSLQSSPTCFSGDLTGSDLDCF